MPMTTEMKKISNTLRSVAIRRPCEVQEMEPTKERRATVSKRSSGVKYEGAIAVERDA
jgi:hypothetical protein